MPAIVITPQGRDANDDMALAVAKQLGLPEPASNAQINAYWRSKAAEFIHAVRHRRALATAGGGVVFPVVT